MVKNSLIKRLGMLAIGGAMAIASSGNALGLEKKVLATSSQTQVMSSPLPSEFSLKKWMTPVQSQGPYGLCYDFAAIAAIEAQLKIALGNPNYNPDLSEQQYPCYDGTYSGGSPWEVLDFAKSTGIVEEKVLPFKGPSSSCYIPANAKRYFVKSWEMLSSSWPLTSNPEEIRNTVKQALIEKGPLIAAMNLGGSKDGNGIYKCNGNTGVTHIVVLYGYKETGDIHTSYWEVKDPNNQITKVGMDWYVNAPEEGLIGIFDQCEITLSNLTSVEVFPANHLGNSIKVMKILTGGTVNDFNLQELDCNQNNIIDPSDAVCSLQRSAGLR